ncbi:MAG: FAD-dependent oxidoreductase [Betaproteobacteria bacterium]|nr:FAD-dependent oxidoreductase [Betaproteobacteria bacterium]
MSCGSCAGPTAILGGGWAGLACAVELAAAGVPVTLFESAKQLGGRARSVDWRGIPIDNGQHLMVGAYRATLRLMQRLGTARLLERRPLDLRVPGFRLALPRLPAPWHLAAGLLRAEGLTWSEKRAAVRFIQHLKSLRFRLPQDLPADRFLRNQPATLVDRLWGPICIAALNTPLATASAQVFCNVLRDSLMGARGDSDLVMNRAAMGRLLPEAAAAFITERGGDVRLSHRIEGVRSDCVGLRLAGWDESFRNVVIATHPAHAAALTTGFPALAGVRAQLAAFTWQPIATLWLRFAAPPGFPFPMLGLGPGQAPWAFERNDLAPGMVAIVESADGPHLRLPPEALRERYLQRLAEAIGPLPALTDWKLIVEKRATWACTPGLDRPDPATPQPGLYLAGDYTAGPYPATLEGAVRSGVECAARILAGACSK